MSHPADWFYRAKFGVFLHFLAATVYQQMRGKELPSPDQWNEQVDAFDVDGVARTVAGTGAGYLFITVGQNNGYHCAPNAVYDGVVGRTHSSRCSRRDLVADLARALEAHGIRLMVYYHGHPPTGDPDWLEAAGVQHFAPMHQRWMDKALDVGGDPGPDDVFREGAERLDDWRALHLDIMREWSERWGGLIHGWWIDGCFPGLQVWDLPGRLGYKEFAAALKAGNPDSIVAFNPALVKQLKPRTPYEDYTAGEVCEALPVFSELFPLERWAGEGVQSHVLGFLGQHWRIGPPRFSDELVTAYSRHLAEHGVVITWDVPVGDYGAIPDEFISQLGLIGRAVCDVAR
jgi:hypothetical protein